MKNELEELEQEKAPMLWKQSCIARLAQIFQTHHKPAITFSDACVHDAEYLGRNP